MTKEKTFGENLKEIESIVEHLEKDEVTLEESIELYKKGMAVLKDCHKKIDTIEKELEIIRDNDKKE